MKRSRLDVASAICLPVVPAGLPVPHGFYITTDAYRCFVNTNGIQPWILETLTDDNSLFSLLLGLGLTLQMDRIEARGGRFVPLYLRRLLILLGTGVVHAFLIWVGDILIFYALFGALLLLFRKAKPLTLLTWAVILLAIPVLFQSAAALLVEAGRSIPEGAKQIERTFADVEASYRSDVEQAGQVYANGSFGEITRQRVHDNVNFIFFGSLYTLGVNVLAMFLLGVYFGKRRIFQDLEANRHCSVSCWSGD